MGVFASLAVPNYRRYFFGILTSNTGTWMSRTAQSWLVLMVLTAQDPVALGYVTALMFVPSLVLSPVGGALADRFPKRALMLTTQSVMAVNVLVLGLLVVTGTVQLWHVYLCALIEGTAAAIDAPARQSFVSEMVPREHLSNAIGLNSTSFNTARLLGPGIAGVLITLVGIGAVFLINACTYAGVITALATLDRSKLAQVQRGGGKGGIRAGFAYVRTQPYLLLILTLAAFMGLFGMNFQMTNVMMAGMVFDQGASEFGLLGTIMAVGTLAAALLAARRKRPRLLVVMVAMGVFTVSMLLSAVAPNFWVFAALLVPCGLAATTMMITCNSLLQLTSSAEYRGRVMSLYMLLFMGSTPVGAPIIGWIGETLGPRWALGLGATALGVVWIIAAIYLARSVNLQIKLDLSRWPWPLMVRRGTITEETHEKIP